MSAKRSILFAGSDPAEIPQLTRDITRDQADWNLTFVQSADEGLDMVSQSAFDVVLTELNLPDRSGVDFLNDVWKIQPKTVRFLRAWTADNDLMMKCIWGTHRFLAKSSDGEALKNAIVRGLELDRWVENPNIKTLVSRMRTFPAIPSLYFKVLREIDSPGASAEALGEIISQDLAMSTKVIKVVNSAFYGLPRQITDVKEAVTIMGLETVKSLVLAIHTFAQLDKVKPLFFSIDQIWKHGLAVGEMARKIVRSETGDPQLAEEAYTAGLLHDIGKVILASNLDTHYNGAISLARKRKIPLTEVEAEIFGASHAETAAYLLALWGLPGGIVEATALHHCPGKGRKEFSTLTAIHVANVFEHESGRYKDVFVPPELDLDYLRELGLEGRLDGWRRIVGLAESRAPQTTAVQTPDNESILPVGKAPPRAPLATQPEHKDESATLPRYAVPVALAGIGIVLILMGWLFFAGFSEPVKTRKSPPSVPETPTSSSGVPETQAASDSANADTLFAEPRTTSAQESLETPPNQTTILPAPAVLSAPNPQTAGNFPSLKLQGIIYRASRPLALVNGQSVGVGAEIDGAKIVEITRDRILVQFGDEKKTLPLGKGF